MGWGAGASVTMAGLIVRPLWPGRLLDRHDERVLVAAGSFAVVEAQSAEIRRVAAVIARSGWAFSSACSWWMRAWARASALCGFGRGGAWAVTADCATTTPPVMASNTAPDNRNKTVYSAVSRSRT